MTIPPAAAGGRAGGAAPRALLAGLAVLAGCSATPDAAPDDAPVTVSVIGPAPAVRAPGRAAPAAPEAVLLGAVAQGLVRFDAAGQIEPGAAIRWDVSDDGLYYIFRLAPDAPIGAAGVARRLRAAIRRGPLSSELSAIADVVAVTDEVVELRLSAPRPDLLALLAQPEMALVGARSGTGPFRIVARDGGAFRLTPRDRDDARAGGAGADVVLRGERAALAVARFKAGRAGVVLGGGFTDLAVARTDGGAATTLHVDPATGLFGFVVADDRGFLSAPESRRALAMALDRDGMVRAFADGWPARTGIVPEGADDLPDPARAGWTAWPMAERIARARRMVAAWTQGRGQDGRPPQVRVGMPAGTGAQLLFARAAADWGRIGVAAVAVSADAPADLRMVDAVAPSGGAAWYLHRFACVRSAVCSEQADRAMAAARAAPDLATRRARLAEADRRIAGLDAFIAIADPLRWSLVAPNLSGYRDNPRARHALDRLRPPEQDR